ncbi:hypothetical protein PENSTE_c021G02743 [Penicillium steckii]|uniref:Aminoglycoside phosphotransferase domain-containing protein n=1 Tax=Penicillium steckii TaxID=303698 RepID=A0A1V6STI6_9EURO|nr:hypothetical protein PENSTE_c021G02743 [Penicillium steckii]
MNIEDQYPRLFELRECVAAMREWKSPFDKGICSAIVSRGMVSRVLGGFEDLFETPQDYETARVKAKEIREIPHHITFTHGDLISHNILIGRDGYLS